MTEIESTTGTCNYMSPEQALGEEVDQRTDIWALGIVMYEMLTGKLPFDAQYDQAIIYSILNKELDLAQLNTQLPDGFSTIIFKCLKKEKDERYQQIEELISELIEIKKDSSITYSALQPKLPTFLSKSRREIISDKTILVAREQELEKLERFLDSALSGTRSISFCYAVNPEPVRQLW